MKIAGLAAAPEATRKISYVTIWPNVFPEALEHIPVDATVLYSNSDGASWTTIYKHLGKYVEVSQVQGEPVETMRLSLDYVAEVMSIDYESQTRAALEALE